ncbi:minichromosome maintenance domain-containing protein 2-like [Argonauta hians]
MVHKANLLASVLYFMDKRNIFKTVKEACQKYEKMENCTFYSFVVEIDSIEIHDENPYLGNMLLNSTNQMTGLFQEVIYYYITLLKLVRTGVELSQVSVVLRLTSVPNIPGIYSIQTFRELLATPEKSRMITLRGIVTGMTALSKYTHHTIYDCPIAGCPGSSSKEYIRTHIPGATEDQIIRNNFDCIYCGSILEEIKPCRYLEDKIIAEVAPSQAFTNSNSFRHQAILVYIRDDLIKMVHLGKEHQFFGIVRRDMKDSEISVTVEANNVTTIPFQPFSGNFKHLPNTLWNIYQNSTETPWRFASSLAYYFADKIAPQGSFWTLKLSVLLNLVCSGCEDSDPLHILVIGQESQMISRLLHYSLQYCPRSVTHSVNNHLTGKVSADTYCMAPYFVEAGSLLLASSGVCYLGDVAQYKKSFVENLRSILIEKKIKLEVGAKFTSGLPHVLEYSLNTRIWAFDSTNFKTAEKYEELVVSKSNFVNQLGYLMEAFNFIIFTNPNDNERLTDHVLAKYFKEDYQRSPIDSDLLELITNLRSWEVNLTQDCEYILKNYYIASRRARSVSMDCSLVPASALRVLSHMTQSFAKLSLRHRALECDAMMAIRLYEESLMLRFGMSVFDVHLSQHNDGETLDSFLRHNDSTMVKFFTQFSQCCSNSVI